MKHLLVVLATLVAPFFASAQEAPNASLVRVGPMPTDQTALGELITAMQAYSRDTCGIALLLRVDPAAFPNDVTRIAAVDTVHTSGGWTDPCHAIDSCSGID